MKNHYGWYYTPRPRAKYGSDISTTKAKIIDANYTRDFMEVVIKTKDSNKTLLFWLGSPIREQPAKEILRDFNIDTPKELIKKKC